MRILRTVLLLLLLTGGAVFAQTTLDLLVSQLLTTEDSQWAAAVERYGRSITPKDLDKFVQMALAEQPPKSLQLARVCDYLEAYPPGKKPYKGRAQLLLVRQMLKAGDNQAAADLAQGLTRSHPDLGAAWLFAGYANLELHEPQKALPFFMRAAVQHPESVQALIGLGRCQVQLGQSNDALKTFKRVLELEPDNGLARDAVAMLGQAEGPPLSSNPEALKHFEAAEAHFEAKRFKAALNEYQLAVQADPKMAVAWVYMGDAHFALGDLEQAITCYQKAISIEPGNRQAHRFLGDMYERKFDRSGDVKLLDEAIKCYQNALKADPNYGAAKDDLKRAQEKRAALP